MYCKDRKGVGILLCVLWCNMRCYELENDIRKKFSYLTNWKQFNLVIIKFILKIVSSFFSSCWFMIFFIIRFWILSLKILYCKHYNYSFAQIHKGNLTCCSVIYINFMFSRLASGFRSCENYVMEYGWKKWNRFTYRPLSLNSLHLRFC